MYSHFLKITGLFINLFIYLASCQHGAASDKSAKSGPLDVAAFESKLTETDHPQLIDVRTPSEYNEGHLKNAVNIDWNGNNFEAEAMKLDKSRPVFLYCLSGGRSKEAADFLKKKEFKTVYELDGGYMKWTAAGKEVTKETTGEKKSDLSDDDYKKLVSADNLVLVDFNAPWCKPCRLLSPILEDVEKEMNGKLKVVRINIDENQQLANTLSIESIPAIYVYKQGKLVWQQVGLLEKKELTDELSKYQ
jgi:thioredoxin 1